MDDRRERPWKKLRVVVEVSVPPHSRADEKDLKHLVEEALPRMFKLPRPIHANTYEAVVRVKAFKPFWPVFLRKEKGIRTGRKPKDQYNGL